MGWRIISCCKDKEGISKSGRSKTRRRRRRRKNFKISQIKIFTNVTFQVMSRKILLIDGEIKWWWPTKRKVLNTMIIYSTRSSSNKEGYIPMIKAQDNSHFHLRKLIVQFNECLTKIGSSYKSKEISINTSNLMIKILSHLFPLRQLLKFSLEIHLGLWILQTLFRTWWCNSSNSIHLVPNSLRKFWILITNQATVVRVIYSSKARFKIRMV